MVEKLSREFLPARLECGEAACGGGEARPRLATANDVEGGARGGDVGTGAATGKFPI